MRAHSSRQRRNFHKPIAAIIDKALETRIVLCATKARTSYQDFFALWKDADPDILILKQAKAEYPKLQ